MSFDISFCNFAPVLTLYEKKMKIDTTRLVRVKNYAQRCGLTVQSIYGRIARGVLQSVRVDGITYVILDKDGNGGD